MLSVRISWAFWSQSVAHLLRLDGEKAAAAQQYKGKSNFNGIFFKRKC